MLIELSTFYVHLLRVSAAYPGLVEHVGHLVDSVQQHVHLALHVLSLPLALLDRVLEHLQVSGLSHHLGLHLLLVLLHPDQLALGEGGGEPCHVFPTKFHSYSTFSVSLWILSTRMNAPSLYSNTTIINLIRVKALDSEIEQLGK